MSFHVMTRWGEHEREPTETRMREVLAELDANDDEHPDVSLTHESEWCLSAYPSGILVYENLEAGEPRHLNHVSRARVLELWLLLSKGQMEVIETEPWINGYEDRSDE
jgi:hypothetical protein